MKQQAMAKRTADKEAGNCQATELQEDLTESPSSSDLVSSPSGRGEHQASTRGLTGVQCGRGEGCNAMSQQNLEEEVGCGQTD